MLNVLTGGSRRRRRATPLLARCSGNCLAVRGRGEPLRSNPMEDLKQRPVKAGRQATGRAGTRRRRHRNQRPPRGRGARRRRRHKREPPSEDDLQAARFEASSRGKALNRVGGAWAVERSNPNSGSNFIMDRRWSRAGAELERMASE